MESLTTLDYGIIGVFLIVILVVGLAASRMASKSMDHYFLGGRNIPWYVLGIAGMSGWFDLTGTMIITSFLYLLGPRGLYIEFRGGAVLVLAFMLAYTGKWARRSGCMTGAEWNTYRFGAGFSGELVRLVSAVIGIVSTIGCLAYLVRGATLFMAMIFPVNPVWLTIGILGIASLYTVMAGFYGMVLTDLVQGAIIIVGCIMVSFIAWGTIPDVQILSETAMKVTGNASWLTSVPTWHATMPKGYEAYESLIAASFFYLLRSILGGMGSGGEARFFAARNTREASLQCLLQGVMVMFRWPLMIGFAILGIFWVSTVVPNNDTLSQACAIIRASNPTIKDGEWHAYTSNMIHHPETAPAGVIDQLKTVLGKDWQAPLSLISARGTVDPEVILPAVLIHSIVPGLRGLLIIALLSALMGVLAGQVNGTSALFVRDIYQNFLRPKASNRELISMAYISSILIVVASFSMGLAAPNINNIWSWLIMGLGAGGLGPAILKLYWWRMNAWGMTAGMVAGGGAAILQRLFYPSMPEWMQFITMSSISIGCTILGSFLTKETPRDVVRYFYLTTRPFGFWAPFRKALSEVEKNKWKREHYFDISSTVCTLVWQVSMFLLPMQLLTHNTMGFLTTLPVFLSTSVGLYFLWWKNLPPINEKIADFVSRPQCDLMESKK
jgi:solute:Na+ symporter, SSS family